MIDSPLTPGEPASRTWIVAVFLLLATWACGPKAPESFPSGVVLRVPLRAEGELAQGETKTVAHFVPKRDDQVTADDPVQWSGAATKEVRFSKVPEKFTPEGKLHENRIPGYIADGEGRKQITLRGSFDPQNFNQVVLRSDNYGPEFTNIQLVFAKDGKDRLRSETFEHRSQPEELTPFAFSFFQNRSLGLVFDELRVEFTGGNSNLVSISDVSLMRVPDHMLLPEDEEGEVMVTLGDESRRGPVLSSKRPLTARMEAPPGARLRFSYGHIDALRGRNQNAKLHVYLKGSQGQIDKTYDLESDPRQKSAWHNVDIELSRVGAGDLELRYELEVAGKLTGYAVVAEPIVTVAGETPPTVLLITSDTHRSDHMGYSGGPVKTPNLDALAARGVTFQYAFSSTNITNPSHIALMTAKGPRDTRIINNHTPLAREANTLAEQFRAQGYRTFASASAFHLAHDESGLGQGFDRLNAPRRNTRIGGVSVTILEEWIAEAAGEPLFVWLHVFDAHAPYVPPDPFDRKYYSKEKDPFAEGAGPGLPAEVDPPFLADLKDVTFAYEQYRAAVDYVDATVARVTDIPRFANGLIAFTADHGESFGDHQIWWDHAELYPTSTQVPLLLVWPGAPGGKSVETSVQHTDIGRTLLDLAGHAGADFPGRNLAAAAEDALDSEPLYGLAAHRMSAYLHLDGYHLIFHIRDHQEWSLERKRYKHELELYNLREDPECTTNLVDAEFERAKKMRAAVVKWLAEAPSTSMGRNKNMSKEMSDTLASLGYATVEQESDEEILVDPDCDCECCLPFH